MKVLIGCEHSGVVRQAFRDRGHDAWSCDILPASDGSQFHIQCDVLTVIDDGWDLAVFHPDCTFLCVSGLHWNERREGRAEQTAAAIEFARKLIEAPIDRIALENPVGCLSTRLRPASQYIQPYNFGEDASKKTGLWLKGLPLLMPTRRIPGRLVEWPRGSGKFVERWSNQTDSGQNRLGPSDDRWAQRAKTYQGIASAMAEQWGKQWSEAESVKGPDGSRRGVRQKNLSLFG